LQSSSTLKSTVETFPDKNIEEMKEFVVGWA